MTDSDVTAAYGARSRRGDKRGRLVAAATRMLYEQGAEATTLADIAHAAGIPLGNVYYYFKTRNDIIAAVIKEHAQEIQSQLDEIDERCKRPAERLKALFGMLGAQSELIARFGCPHGSLCQELGKRAAGAPGPPAGLGVPGYPGAPAEPGGGAPDASRLVQLPIDWAERQFAALGQPNARDLAIQVVGAYQGAALLTSALRDPGLLERESRRIADWIDSLS
jgi:AcrR family transcriptional regulator